MFPINPAAEAKEKLLPQSTLPRGLPRGGPLFSKYQPVWVTTHLGWLSCGGVLPACRSLDMVSVFALCVEDAEAITAVAAAYDEADPYSRSVQGHGFEFGRAVHFRVGMPRASQLKFFGILDTERLYFEAIEPIRALGGTMCRHGPAAVSGKREAAL